MSDGHDHVSPDEPPDEDVPVVSEADLVGADFDEELDLAADAGSADLPDDYAIDEIVSEPIEPGEDLGSDFELGEVADAERMPPRAVLDDLDAEWEGDVIDATRPAAYQAPVWPPSVAAAPPEPADERLQRVEAVARELAGAQLNRERGRIRRKVSAATFGAGAASAIPTLLQIAGAFELSPELSAAVSGAAALLGAFAAGWATPERRSPISPGTIHELGLASPPPTQP